MNREWQTMKLEDAILVNPQRHLSKGVNAPFVAMENLVPYQRDIEIKQDREYRGSGARFTNGDTLFARITPCLENGKTAFISDLPQNVVGHGSTEFIVVSGKENISDSLFVYYLVRDPNFRSYAIQRMEGTSGRQRVPVSALSNLVIELPPLPKQRAIAHILGTLDDKIELNHRMNQTLEAMAQALFKSWFVDFEPFRHQDMQDSPQGEIPVGWRTSSIGNEVTVVGGSTPSTKEKSFWEGGTHCWATPRDLSMLRSPILLDTERHITDDGLATISSGLLPAGTVLLSSRAPVGYLAISLVPVAINQGFIAMVCNQQLTNHFVFLWSKYNLDNIKGRANGTTFPEISKSNFRPISVIVPQDTVCESFDQLVSPVFSRIAGNIRESQTLTAIRDALLPKLLSGEIRVKDAEKFVESRL